ncbi:PEP-CTERM sorting domain-containing protein [Pseudoduganella namucuonensis]|uniref:PEP-CTERM protein-sorting domain-containing protein n=1 Tax=Pseudoduganella namucuonensis TaxID=1035707 RepID=A0A1I7J9J0_9BURK|nr:PEP-CTERM sorting domain-containing protein [Pseudoduganella namucuonensis]SFU81828.1 PEP-CTERM protein-sorting domain-containing protein [Pseudoduganella namucuonensis]
MKKALYALIAGATLVLAGAAHAGVVNFDNVATGGDFTSLNDISPHSGLNWSADWYAGDNSIGGYGNAAHSGTNYAVNGFGSDAASVSSATGFNFAGAWFAAPVGVADKASWINISAYDAANQLIGSTGNVAIGASHLWVGAAFGNVSFLTITRDSGWYVMDDFTTTAAATTVPEPGTQLTLGIGLLALVVARRRSAR